MIEQPASMEMRAKSPSLRRQVGGQGALIVTGFAGAQLFALARNALIGHLLSQGDFGIAAAITLTLQLVETLSDIGSDRLIIQSSEGENPQLMAVAHMTWLARGFLIGAMLLAAAPVITSALAIPHASTAFMVASLVPVIKAFTHLDMRRYQRRLDNRALVLFEAAPQAVAFFVSVPILLIWPTYEAIPAVLILAALSGTVLSHALAERPYRVGINPRHLGETIRFGWPLWLSAVPLVVVYQGDRLLVGGMLGMEALAAYSVAFMIATIPGFLAAKIGNALWLPLLAQAKDSTSRFLTRYLLMAELIVILSVCYLTGFTIAGEAVLPVVFGPNYDGLGAIVTLVAIMWSTRMLQSVPGMALMASGDTRPLLIAGLIRALGLLLAYVAAAWGLGLQGVAAAGGLAELGSLMYVAIRAGRDDQARTRGFLLRCMALVPITAIALVTLAMPLPEMTAAEALTVAIVASMAVGCAAALVLPLCRTVIAAELLRRDRLGLKAVFSGLRSSRA